jgi:hypothetical protein
MSLQDVPKTAAETAVKLVRVPVDLANKAREEVEKRIGGGDKAAISEAQEPAVEPTKGKAAKPKATKKPAAKKAPAAKKPAAKKPAAKRASTQKTAPKAKPAKNPSAGAIDRAEDARKKLQNGAGGRSS